MRNQYLRGAVSLITLLVFAHDSFAAQKIIGFGVGVNPVERVNSVESVGGKVLRGFHFINAVVAEISDNIKDNEISSLSGVTFVEDDRHINWIDGVFAPPLPSAEAIVRQISNDEDSFPVPQVSISRQEPEGQPEIPWGVKRVNASAVWPSATGKGVKVAIIDTGVDYTHPDLKENFAGGYNAIIPSTSTIDAMDDNGHGTHVAGTIAARRNAHGVVGVAPEAQIFAVKALEYDGTGKLSWIIAAIEWAVDNHMSIINMSLGGPYPADSLAQAIKAAYRSGLTIVCAAGNTSGEVNYPAKYPESIAVSASDSSDTIASFSSRGPEIAFIAPGVDVYSTFPIASYASKSGTSMASPHVAGLSALAVSLGADTPEKVKGMLLKAAVKLDLQPIEQGAGLIDAGKFIKYAH